MFVDGCLVEDGYVLLKSSEGRILKNGSIADSSNTYFVECEETAKFFGEAKSWHCYLGNWTKNGNCKVYGLFHRN